MLTLGLLTYSSARAMSSLFVPSAVPLFRKSRLRGILKGVFWTFLCLILAMLISYVFFIFSWLILGAVIRPQAFLPYCTAVVTLFAHARATSYHLMDSYHHYRLRIAAVVAAIFAAKIVATLTMGKKARESPSTRISQCVPDKIR